MIRSILKKLWRRQDGALTVETALSVPLFLTLVVGTLEVGNYFFLASSLENAVLRASRFGVTGADGSELNREAQVLAIIERETFGRIPITAVTIETEVFEQFGDIGETEPYVDMDGSGNWEAGEPFTDVNGNGIWDDSLSVAGLGGAGDIVLYTASFNAESLTGLFDWAHIMFPMQAAVAVRNEPF